ncbi:zinc finger protein with KRAB and SCAN domains 5-like [Gigantopelta aegis]|uniref:zinc finger protein with KRAB and SCAN domains 5-like n=1 Tax=Gigantopelta aegis TaxID=1735272 RepID=UPI001B88D4FC|nr:zinc finger protein with KRAB and SCAN domains 5-like [Gigantopelta aegis]
MDSLLHYTSVNHADCLIGEINKLRRNEQLCDVLIIVGDYRIPAHRLILSACMPYFHSLLDDKPRANRPAEVILSDIDGEATKNIIEFCYTSAISITEENVLMLLPTAFTFQLDEISNLCCDFLVSQLHVKNCLIIHQVAVQCACHDLEQESAAYIQKHFDEILAEDSFLELPIYSVSQSLSCLQEEILDNTQVIGALRKWVEHQTEDRQKFAPEIAYYFPKLVDKLKEFLPEDLLMSLNMEDCNAASPAISNHDDNSPSKTMDSPLSYLDSPTYRHSNSPLPKHYANHLDDSYVPTNGLSIPIGLTIICTICGEIFDSQTELNIHRQECEDSVPSSAPADIPEFPTTNTNTTTTTANSVANTTNIFSSKPNYLRCDGSPKHSDLPFQGFPCPICGKHFPCKKNLGKHIKIHSQFGFECEVCYKKYSTKSNLQGHMRIHSGEKPYNCEFCGKGFVSYCVLKVHIRTHTGEKPFPCPTCGVSFAKNIHLKRHLQIHTGTKPHRCDICSKHFSRSDHLKRHIQSIHSGAKPHSCSLCGKDFVRKYELNKHFKLHFAATMDGSLAIIDPSNDSSFSNEPTGTESPRNDEPMGADSPSPEAALQEENIMD